MNINFLPPEVLIILGLDIIKTSGGMILVSSYINSNEIDSICIKLIRFHDMTECQFDVVLFIYI